MITISVNDISLDFEHSLVSLSDWEAHYEKAFYLPKITDDETRTEEEMMKYFEFMLLDRSHRHLIQLLSQDQQLILAEYLNKARTATTVREIQKSRGASDNITSELVYYWLVTFKIPFKPTDEWHLNRLLMLVRVCSAKQAPPPKGRQSRAKLAQNMREINEQRRAATGSSG